MEKKNYDYLAVLVAPAVFDASKVQICFNFLRRQLTQIPFYFCHNSFVVVRDAKDVTEGSSFFCLRRVHSGRFGWIILNLDSCLMVVGHQLALWDGLCVEGQVNVTEWQWIPTRMLTKIVAVLIVTCIWLFHIWWELCRGKNIVDDWCYDANRSIEPSQWRNHRINGLIHTCNGRVVSCEERNGKINFSPSSSSSPGEMTEVIQLSYLNLFTQYCVTQLIAFHL